MAKLDQLKISLAKRIFDSVDIDKLQVINELMSSSEGFKLTAQQKKELDMDLHDHEAGDQREHTWADVKSFVRRKRAE